MNDVCPCLLCRQGHEQAAVKKRRIWTAIVTAILLVAAFYLTSCAPFQMAGTNKSGPYVVQSGGILHKMTGGVLKAKHGDIVLEQILEGPDGTEVAQGLLDAKTTLGLGKLYKDERVAADNNKTKVDLGAQDVQKHEATLKAQGTATSEAIGAGAEVNPVTVTAPGS